MTAKFLQFLETGATKVEVMKTVPIHYWPPLRSVANNPDFLDQPLLKTPAGQRSLEVLREAVESGQFPVTESGTAILKVGKALSARLLASTLEQIVVSGVDPEAAVKAAAEKLD